MQGIGNLGWFASATFNTIVSNIARFFVDPEESQASSDERLKNNCLKWEEGISRDIDKLCRGLFDTANPKENNRSIENLSEKIFIILLNHRETLDDIYNKIEYAANETNDQIFQEWASEHLELLFEIKRCKAIYQATAIESKRENNSNQSLSNRVEKYNLFFLNQLEKPEFQTKHYKDILNYLNLYWPSIRQSLINYNPKSLQGNNEVGGYFFTYVTKSYNPSIDSIPREELNIQRPISITLRYEKTQEIWHTYIHTIEASKLASFQNIAGYMIDKMLEQTWNKYSKLISEARRK